MKYVIDASVGFKWEVLEADSDKARQLRDDFVNSVHQLLAPDLFPTEVGNALLVAERRGRIAAGDSPILLADVITTLPALLPAVPDLLPRALEIARQANRSIYDCLYVALAEKEACELVTSDQKLFATLQPQFPFIILLASFP
jgi:predicted nucleic acid-binding protein